MQQQRRRHQRQRPRCQPPRALLPVSEALLAAVSASGLETFEPQLRPEIGIAAAAAAAPPIIFWARIFLSAQRRQQAIDAEKAAEAERQRARDKLKRKITGQDGAPPRP